MTTRKKLHKLNQQRREQLDAYMVERKYVDEQYHRAKNLLEQLSEKSYRDKELQKKYCEWIVNGGTLKLKDILYTYTDYDGTDLTDFNAFATLDSVSAQRNIKNYGKSHTTI